MKLKDHKEINFGFNAVEFYAPGKALESVNLDGFRLDKFEDLRKKSESLKRNTLMLRAKNGTYAYIDAPDSVLDELILKLPNYINKSWVEIENIEIENI